MTQQEFFSRYTFNIRTDKIGGGGFGTVYKAYDNTLHRDVAIKVSEVKTAANGKTFSLKDEFEALNGLPAHPNIANYDSLYSFEMPNGLFDYAVMQFYPDGNLSNLIRAGLDSDQKEDLALQLLEGVSFLHQHNVVHRDLKPGNILIVKHGGKVIPLITDFGLSKTADTTDRSMFSNSFGGGTARYSSPEQLQGQPLRLNTDLWSYGVIVYELFTGDPLFEPSSSAANSAQADLEIYNKIVNGDMGGRLSSVPEKWRRVLERCLVVDPAQRAKSAEELFAVLSPSGDPASEECQTVVETDKPDSASPQPMPADGGESTFVEKPASRETAEPETVRPAVAGSQNPRKAFPQTPAPDSRNASPDKPKPKRWLPWVIGGAAALLLTLAIVLIVRNVNSGNNLADEPIMEIDSAEIATVEEFAPAECDEEKEVAVKVDEKVEKKEEQKEDNSVHLYAQEMPDFPGGVAAMDAFLKKELQYPEVARKNGITGTILVEFVVEKDGRLTNVKVKVPLFPDCDQEAVRAVKAMPRWIPGKNNGKPVRCSFQVPVTFRM